MTIKKVPQFRFNISARRKNKLALRMCDEKQVNRT
jgi:hypothetical protein